METLKSTNSKGIIFSLLFILSSSSVFSQNKLSAFVSSFNFEWAVPIVCVLGLGLFLIKAFISQKNSH
jgi:hypothetical protein